MGLPLEIIPGLDKLADVREEALETFMEDDVVASALKSGERKQVIKTTEISKQANI